MYQPIGAGRRARRRDDEPTGKIGHGASRAVSNGGGGNLDHDADRLAPKYSNPPPNSAPVGLAPFGRRSIGNNNLMYNQDQQCMYNAGVGVGGGGGQQYGRRNRGEASSMAEIFGGGGPTVLNKNNRRSEFPAPPLPFSSPASAASPAHQYDEAPVLGKEQSSYVTGGTNNETPAAFGRRATSNPDLRNIATPGGVQGGVDEGRMGLFGGGEREGSGPYSLGGVDGAGINNNNNNNNAYYHNNGYANNNQLPIQEMPNPSSSPSSVPPYVNNPPQVPPLPSQGFGSNQPAQHHYNSAAPTTPTAAHGRRSQINNNNNNGGLPSPHQHQQQNYNNYNNKMNYHDGDDYGNGGVAAPPQQPQQMQIHVLGLPSITDAAAEEKKAKAKAYQREIAEQMEQARRAKEEEKRRQKEEDRILEERVRKANEELEAKEKADRDRERKQKADAEEARFAPPPKRHAVGGSRAAKKLLEDPTPPPPPPPPPPAIDNNNNKIGGQNELQPAVVIPGNAAGITSTYTGNNNINTAGTYGNSNSVGGPHYSAAQQYQQVPFAAAGQHQTLYTHQQQYSSPQQRERDEQGHGQHQQYAPTSTPSFLQGHGGVGGPSPPTGVGGGGYFNNNNTNSNSNTIYSNGSGGALSLPPTSSPHNLTAPFLPNAHAPYIGGGGWGGGGQGGGLLPSPSLKGDNGFYDPQFDNDYSRAKHYNNNNNGNNYNQYPQHQQELHPQEIRPTSHTTPPYNQQQPNRGEHYNVYASGGNNYPTNKNDFLSAAAAASTERTPSRRPPTRDLDLAKDVPSPQTNYQEGEDELECEQVFVAI